MKKNLIYILIGVAVLCASCGDSGFFRTESPSAMDKTVFTIPSQAEQVIAGVYQQLGEQNSYRTRLGGPWVGLGTDCENYRTSSTGNTPDYAIYTMTKDGNSDLTAAGKNPWAYLTTAIERANIAIAGLEENADTTQVEFAYLLGEALTLRAWLHYEMLKLWGDIPAMFAPIDVEDETSVYPAKVDRNIVFEQLRKDLRRAAELMPEAANCPGAAKNTVQRCNRQFALALLARIDLVYAGKALRPNEFVVGGSDAYGVQFNIKDDAKRAEVMGEAVWACEQVMNIDGIDLGKKLKANYRDVFKAITSGTVAYNATETLFEIPFANGIRGQFLNRMGASVDNTAFGHLIYTTASSKSNAKVVITPDLLFSYDAKDARKWVTCHPYSWTYDNKKTSDVDPSASGNILYQKATAIQNVTCGKFCHEDLGYDMVGDEDGVNIPVMRYADVLLMYAEASIGGVAEVTPSYKGSYDAQMIFDLVRQRANLASTPLTMDAIMQERAWEFTGEFIRKFDLMRWGVFASRLKKAQKTFEYFTKVSEEKIDFSGTPFENQLATDVYVRYTRADEYNREGGAAYVISEIYGLSLGENDKPADYVSSTENGGWVKTDPYISDGSVRIALDDEHGSRIYASTVEETLEYRQYWPLFNVITSANHNLWNDYIYR